MGNHSNPLKKTLTAPALPLIALLFAAGAALKTGEVIAALGADAPTEDKMQTEQMEPGHTAEPAMEPADQPEMESASPPSSHQPPNAEAMPAHTKPQGINTSGPETGEACVSEQMMSAIKERSQALDQREARLAGKIRSLEVVEKRVAEEIARLERDRVSLERILAAARNESNEDMTRLIQIYANMKPKRAAVIFDEMAPEIAAGFIRRMRGNAASFILANMDSKKAYAITLMIAGAEAPFQNK